MKVHFIAIGGSAMHNFALAMHHNGMQVSGSDDEILEPSRSRLLNAGILPQETGWFPEKIHADLDAVILGMHARADNLELLKAQELGIKVYSYPGYIFEQSRNKRRMVIGGSHGKTSITAMTLHVLSKCGINTDYLVGAQLKGYDTMVKISKEADLILLEGDEYLSSPIERVPKFHLYRPHVAVLSGIAWDHINVFPTFENYLSQFSCFIDLIEPEGVLFYYNGDEELRKIVEACNRTDIRLIPYSAHKSQIKDGITYLLNEEKLVELKIFGQHNLQNLMAAKHICLEAGVSENDFYQAISSFEGAAKRLELVYRDKDTIIYKDFAHSPSKLKATTEAVKAQFSGRKLVACMELHTFSSLNAAFLFEYKDSMSAADRALIYYNPHTVSHKKLESISKNEVREAFGEGQLEVFNNSKDLIIRLQEINLKNSVLLMMSSGNFDGIKFEELSETVL